MRTPLTEVEHERLRMLIAWSPRGWQAVDERLIALGLARKWDAESTEALWEQVGPEGIEPYYERDGSVNQVSYPIIGQPDVLDPANAPQRSKR